MIPQRRETSGSCHIGRRAVRCRPGIHTHLLEEEEARPDGRTVRVATVFLTNRECPWRCLMYDLWRSTLEGTVPEGAIAAQVQYALDHLPSFPTIRAALTLYNSGSFSTREQSRLRNIRRSPAWQRRSQGSSPSPIPP